MEQRRRIEVVWIGEGEIADYERLLKNSKKVGVPPGEFIKALLRKLP